MHCRIEFHVKSLNLLMNNSKIHWRTLVLMRKLMMTIKNNLFAAVLGGIYFMRCSMCFC